MGKSEGQTEYHSDEVKKVILELPLNKKGIKQFSKNLKGIMQDSDILTNELTELIGNVTEAKQHFILWYVDNEDENMKFDKLQTRADKVAKRLAKKLDVVVIAVAVTDGSHSRLEAVYTGE